jgi:hypothetical protein
VTLDLWLAAQNFTMPVTPPSVNDATSLTLIPTFGSGSVSLDNCVDLSNGTAPASTAPTGPHSFCSMPAPGTPINDSMGFSGNTSSSTNNTALLSTITSPFSLSEHVTITFTGASELEIQTRQVLTPVPEPAAILLLGSTLLGVTTLFRKKLARR